MNRQFLFSALFILVSFFSFGQGYQVQSKYFVYLQTEPAQPFYIKINNQKIEANASGYLILPQLKDGDYKLIVGFTQGKADEQAFNFRIDSKDKGYLIKDYGADGWGLFDLQTMAVQKAIKGGAKEVEVVKQMPPATPKAETKKEESVAAEGISDFTKVLSQAANDPSLLEKPKPVPVEEKQVVQPPFIVNKPVEKVDNASSTVKERIVSNTKSGSGDVRLVYDDRNELGQVDPITIFISAPANSSNEEFQQPAEEQQKPEAKLVEKPAVKKAEVKVVENVVPKVTNIACKQIAEEDDFLKLRRIMASQTNDDSMIEQAKKAFSAKCYSTAQVKYLSSMFLSNAGKYNFYVAAQPFISDKENFSSLASEIKDESYRNKFNSLVQ